MIARITRRRQARKAARPPSPSADGVEDFHRRLIAAGDLILRHRWTPLIIVLIVLALHIALHQLVLPSRDPLEVAARACAAQGEWFDVGSAETIDQKSLMRLVSGRSLILLGKTESADLDEGRWLGFTIAALYHSRRHLVVAIDAFPPSQQPLLDKWVRGEIGEADLLASLDWRFAYTPDPHTYLPLLRLVRLYRLPLIAVGLDPAASARLEVSPRAGAKGPQPVDPPEGYRRSLAALYLAHQLTEPDPRSLLMPSRLIFSEELTPVLVSGEFQRFLLERREEDWLIAQELAAARRRPGRPLVVGVVGRNHLEYRWGVPTQLAALGIDDVAVLLPFAGSGDCALIRPGIADAVFILEPGPIASASAALPFPDPVIGRTGGASGRWPVTP